MTTIAIFGGTGYVGGHVAREAVRRGHTVTSYSRTGPREPDEGVEYRLGSFFDPPVARDAATHDVVVVALHAVGADGSRLADGMPAVADAVEQAGGRLVVSGGAGSSLLSEGGPRLVDQPEFLDDWKPEALAHADVLEWLRTREGTLDWVYVSPAALFGSFAPGETTGTYRTNGDVLVTKPDGSSEISGTDYALAVVDEIEQPRHRNRRFTVGH